MKWNRKILESFRGMYFSRSTRYNYLNGQNSICKMVFYSEHLKNDQL